MISFFSRHRRIIFIATVVVFLVGIFVGLGAYVFTSGSMDAVAEVNGEKIPYHQFQLQVSRATAGLRESGTETNENMAKLIQQEILREMIIEEILCQQAAKMGMRVTDFEVAIEIQNQFVEEGRFSPRAYFTYIYNDLRMSPSEYESWRKRARLAAKFKQFLYSSVKIAPEELKAYYLARNRDLKDFEKQKDKYQDELAREKFANVANYMLKQLTSKMEIRDYLREREQGG